LNELSRRIRRPDSAQRAWLHLPHQHSRRPCLLPHPQGEFAGRVSPQLRGRLRS